MLGGADNPNGELPSYITGANMRFLSWLASMVQNISIIYLQFHPAMLQQRIRPCHRVEPRQPGGCKLKTAPVRPVVAARPAE
ncbi:hypothetical protein PO357_22925, partial [Escherichia coli]